LTKKITGLVLGATIVFSMLGAAGANAEVPTEEPSNPCFAVGTGTLERTHSRSTTESSYNYYPLIESNVMVNRSGSLHRAYSYSGYLQRQEVQYSARVSNITYDFENLTKTVSVADETSDYFTTYLFERFIGFLVDSDGNNVGPLTSWNASTNTYDLRGTSYEFISTTTYSRDCSGSSGSGGSGSGSSFNPENVVELDLDGTRPSSFEVIAFSGTGIQTVSIATDVESLVGAAKLLVWNDPYSTENVLGFASLGFQLRAADGSAVNLLKPIRVNYQVTSEASLAVSDDAKNWELLGNGNIKFSSDQSLLKVSSEAFVLSSLSNSKWLFVGQKTPMSNPVLYASKFDAGVGNQVRLTTTGGQGKGSVVISSDTPGTCKPEGLKRIKGVGLGLCKVSATKFGFDGYLDSDSQVLELRIGG
jgi:hypothetical protein